MLVVPAYSSLVKLMETRNYCRISFINARGFMVPSINVAHFLYTHNHTFTFIPHCLENAFSPEVLATFSPNLIRTENLLPMFIRLLFISHHKNVILLFCAEDGFVSCGHRWCHAVSSWHLSSCVLFHIWWGQTFQFLWQLVETWIHKTDI